MKRNHDSLSTQNDPLSQGSFSGEFQRVPRSGKREIMRVWSWSKFTTGEGMFLLNKRRERSKQMMMMVAWYTALILPDFLPYSETLSFLILTIIPILFNFKPFLRLYFPLLMHFPSQSLKKSKHKSLIQTKEGIGIEVKKERNQSKYQVLVNRNFFVHEIFILLG